MMHPAALAADLKPFFTVFNFGNAEIKITMLRIETNHETLMALSMTTLEYFYWFYLNLITLYMGIQHHN
ncbi:Uncharacterised protein [Aeromonas salmonicida]|nr:Uncharacterised protein [Aeromonas salmonicida]